MKGKWLVAFSLGLMGLVGASTAYLWSDGFQERGNAVNANGPGGDRGCGDSKADEGCGYDKP